MWKQNKLNSYKQSRVVTKGWRGGGNGEISVKEYKLQVRSGINAGDLMCMVTIVNNTVLYVQKLLRE